MANKGMAHLVHRGLWVVAATLSLWMTSTDLQLRIWLMIKGINQMMMLKNGAQIQEASWQRKQASKSLEWSIQGGLSGSNHTLKSSETILLVSLLVTSKAMFLMRLWEGMFPSPWRVDGWVIIWSVLERFWVSLWCFVYIMITSVICMHEKLCWHFMMLGLMVQKLVFSKGTVEVIGFRVWLSCNLKFGIFAQRKLAQMISETWIHLSSSW